MKTPIWLGSLMMLGLAMLATPVPAQAQTTADLLAVQTAIKAEMARPGSGIAPSDVTVSNIRFETVFATADVAGTPFNSPIVFVRNTAGTWAVVYVGVAASPADCQHIGFTGGSLMCPN